MSATDVRDGVRLHVWAATGLGVAAALMVVAMALPAITGWAVHVRSFPPLHAEWSPRLGQGTLPALVLAALAVTWFPGWSRTAKWGRLLVGCSVAALAWMLALAAVDGWDGIGVVLTTKYEYLGPAQDVTDVRATLAEYTDRIPFAHPEHWPPHVAGHPPGALLFFVALVRLGLGSGLAAGLVVTVVAASVPGAVLVTLRRLGAEGAARSVAPLLVIGPAALWMAVSADAVFTAAAGWGIAALAVAATAMDTRRAVGWSLVAGLLLGCCVMLSYGLPLLGVLVVAVLAAAGTVRPLPWVVTAAVAVVVAFGVGGGFWWWDALPVLHERYWDGVARNRPASYWLWANLAAFAFAAGPAVGAAAGAVLARAAEGYGEDPTRPGGSDPPQKNIGLAHGGVDRVVVLLGGAALLMVALADASLMSKGEVERIWLPFAPWSLLGLALLSDAWRRRALAVQAVTALVLQHLLFTGW
jgi:hypothetical protein